MEEMKEERTFILPGGATIQMVWIEPGTFPMGSPYTELGRFSDEGPQHEVTITQGFYLGMFALTQAQWENIIGMRPWEGEFHVQEGPDNPAVYISWDDMQEFIGELNQVEGAEVYRLPTEAEWEYSCRAGTTTRWSFGNNELQLGQYAWYSERYAHKVGTKLPNRWGLYDMHGNVREWVRDRYGLYSSGAKADPTGPATGSYRVVRGTGSYRVVRGAYFNSYARFTRSSRRGKISPGVRHNNIGARLVRVW